MHGKRIADSVGSRSAAAPRPARRGWRAPLGDRTPDRVVPQEDPPVIGRVAAIGAIALAAVVLAIVLVGGGDTHSYSMEFENAGQLVKDDDVQVGGRRIGSVRSIKLTKNNLARIEIEV